MPRTSYRTCDDAIATDGRIIALATPSLPVIPARNPYHSKKKLQAMIISPFIEPFQVPAQCESWQRSQPFGALYWSWHFMQSTIAVDFSWAITLRSATGP